MHAQTRRSSARAAMIEAAKNRNAKRPRAEERRGDRCEEAERRGVRSEGADLEGAEPRGPSLFWPSRHTHKQTNEHEEGQSSRVPEQSSEWASRCPASPPH